MQSMVSSRGLSALLSVGVLCCSVRIQLVAQTSGVLREVYTGIAGETVADLTNSVNYPGNPSREEILTQYFEAPTDLEDTYGQRLRALLIPPTTGNYVFWIASDDNSVLWLSSDATPANKVAIAEVPGWTSSREWTKYSSQVSSSQYLTAGQQYYIEALMKEGGGGDNLAVRWQLPSGSIEEPIPASRLLVYGLGPPEITQQPGSVTVVEGGTATFSVQLARTIGATYQWLRGGSSIPGATNASYSLSPVALADSGAQFRCSVANPYGSTNSTSATLTVQADTTAPTLVSVVNPGDPQMVTVLFSEPVETASATTSANYSLNNGASVTSATFAGDTRTILLKTSTLSRGVTYTLTVVNVRDRSTAANPIQAPNNQKSFTIDYTAADIASLYPNLEPIGPSSRRGGLVFSEIMYHPTNRTDGRVLEFVEIYNSQVFAENIGGWRITGTIDFTFPTNTTIAAGGYLVVAPNPADVQAVYGISGVLGGFTDRLSNSEGTLRLRNLGGAVILEVTYSADPPWPAAADGAGHSLVLARPSFGEASPTAWAASDLIGGSPGRAETTAANPYRTVVINEFLAHTDPPDIDSVELYNYGTAAVNLSGCILTDDPEAARFVIGSGVTIPAGGFVTYTTNELGFALNASGETLYLFNPAATKVLDAVRFEDQENGVSSGRYPDGAPAFYRLASPTFGAENAKPLVSPVVLNEILYNPISGNDDDEYVELHNRTGVGVSLAGWRLSGGIDYEFPIGATIAANGYVVVANNRDRLLANYPNLAANPGIVYGDYGGNLANGGERIALSMPDDLIDIVGSFTVTNTIHVVVDEVTYRDGGRWGRWSDGGGSSLERIDPHSDARQAPNWADSDESAKSPWVTVEFTGTLDNGAMAAADALHLFLQDEGECLVDNVEVVTTGNMVSNGGFESGSAGWYFQGTHDQSTIEDTGGYGGGKCLHLRASARGDTGANRVRTPLTSSLSSGSVATLRAKVRWLKGNHEILLRLRGNYLEAFTNIVAARNLGTPGAVNSRYLSNVGPAIHDVSHSPITPSAGQAVTVRAQVGDPDGVAALTLQYRVDPATNFTAISMTYRGAGLYTATIPGQTSGSIVAFHIQAADASSPVGSTRFPDDAPTRECLIRFGDPVLSTGRVGTYRLWVTQATINRWTARERNSNDPLDGTFAYGTHRVVYNIGTLYSGSPWHTPGYNGPLGNICDYVVRFPADDDFLGDTDLVLASTGNLSNDSTAQREQTAFWMLQQLGVPTLYRRFFNLVINGQQRATIYEDAQQPGSDIIDTWYPDDADGDLHKIEDWFEFDDSGDTRLGNVDATLQDFTTTGGVKKLARYRWCWRKRAVKDSANDYVNLFALVDTLNSTRPEPYTSQIETWIDIEEWVRIIAVEHIVGNWDSYGHSRGKNMYAYKPALSPWVLLPWDIDFLFDNGGDDASTTVDPNSFSITDPVLRTFLTFPPVTRAYWRAIEDAISGPMVSTTVSTLMNAKYNGLTAAGIGVSSPSSTISWIATRRSNLQTQLAGVAASFSITSNGGNNFSTNQNYITLTGTAPISVKTIEVNGVAYPPTWTGLTSWSLTYALTAGNNALSIVGYDLRGNPVSGATDSITVNYTGASELPQDFLAINEIMYNPAVPDTSFIEIHNHSSNTAFDLSNFRIDGADFAFPEGTIIPAGGFLVVVNDPYAFAGAYGAEIPVDGIYQGRLDNGGETLKLVQPGLTPDLDAVIDEVTYDDDAPWPSEADGYGPSLQLIDPTQDNNRVANWAATLGGGAAGGTNTLITMTDTWRYNQSGTDLGTAWKETTYNDASWSSGAALLYNESADLPAAKNTPLNIGNTTYYFRKTFTYSGNPATTALRLWAILDDGAVVYLNGRPVRWIGMDEGVIPTYSTFASRTVGDATLEGPLTIDSTYLVAGVNVIAVEVHQVNSGSTDIVFGLALEAVTTAAKPYTPRAANSVAQSLPALPLVWLNEAQPNNVSGAQDRFGDRDPWVELHNSGTTAADLTGYYLSDTYTNLTKWPFPDATSLASGGFRLVWCDNEPGETGSGELHSSFRLSSTGGSVVLTKVSGSVTTIVDYLNYPAINVDQAYGAFPDGTPTKRLKLYYATPSGPNTNAYPGFPITINEWLAGNTITLPDTDGDFEDWFELYNAGSTAVDLSGFTLTDDTNNPALWTIPDNTIIPANGYLLVWADGEPGQNEAGATELHADFKLGAGGDTIALYAPNGTNLDLVTFGQQTNDVSQGRYPDGNSGDFYFMSVPTPRAANSLDIVISNSPPLLTLIGAKSVNETETLHFTATATDPDTAQTLTFTLDAGAPAGASINSESGVFSWTPTEAQGPGSYSITVRVTDNGTPAYSDYEILTVTVAELNSAPTLSAVDDQTVGELAPLTLAPAASDPDRPTQTLTFSLEPGAPAGLTIDPSTGLLAWTPLENQGPGTYSVTIVVTDNGSPPLNAARTFSIAVSEVNTAPTLVRPADQTISELSPFDLQLTATDGDIPANTLTFGLINGPSGLTVSSGGLLSWTPTENQGPSTNAVTLYVVDNGSPNLTNTASFSIVVSEVNTAPVLTSIGNQSVDEGSALTFQISATDADLPAQTLTYSMDAGAPSGATFDAGTRTFTWTPTETQGPGTNTVTFRVADGGSPAQSDSEAIQIIVNEVNTAPVLAAIDDQTTTAGTLLTFTVSATDPDLPANTLQYELDPGAPAGAAINPDTGVFSWTPTPEQAPGTNSVTITVTDNGVAPLSDTVTFVIRVDSAAVLRLTEIALDPAGNLSLSWISTAGKTYRLDHRPALGSGDWILGSEYPATDTTTTVVLPPDGSPERYYRVVQLD